MTVHCFLSKLKQTNNYLVEIGQNQFIGIDLGLIEVGEIIHFVEQKGGQLIAYFLTHAHADHAYGLQEIHDTLNIPIYCSRACAEEVSDAKKNMSFYMDDVPTFSHKIPFHLIEDGFVNLDGCKEIELISVPGHSAGCLCVKIDNLIFTGDFLMEYKTPLNFRTSNKKDYQESLKKIMKRFDDEKILCYPGHGKSFNLFEKLRSIENSNQIVS